METEKNVDELGLENMTERNTLPSFAVKARLRQTSEVIRKSKRERLSLGLKQ